MIELCKVVPEIGTSVLLDEKGKFSNLDFHNYGTFSPRDIATIANTLRPQLFTVIKPYADHELKRAQETVQKENIPSTL